MRPAAAESRPPSLIHPRIRPLSSPQGHGPTPLQAAAAKAHFECLVALAEAGAAVDAQDAVSSADTALCFAPLRARLPTAIAALAVGIGMPVGAAYYCCMCAWHRALQVTQKHRSQSNNTRSTLHPTPYTLPWQSGQTALHLSVDAGDPDCVRALLALGADRGVRDAAGRTAWDRAAAQRRGGEMLDVLGPPPAATAGGVGGGSGHAGGPLDSLGVLGQAADRLSLIHI